MSLAVHTGTGHAATETGVLRFDECDRQALTALLDRYGLAIEQAPANRPVPGSFWGEQEAGLVGSWLFARPDTPVHSILHEACHFICMDPERRAGLHTDAGGDYDEENAVCYLQIVLAGKLADVGRDRIMADMDRWGYTFRLGSARAWFENDAGDAREWLRTHGILPGADAPGWRCRGDKP